MKTNRAVSRRKLRTEKNRASRVRAFHRGTLSARESPIRGILMSVRFGISTRRAARDRNRDRTDGIAAVTEILEKKRSSSKAPARIDVLSLSSRFEGTGPIVRYDRANHRKFVVPANVLSSRRLFVYRTFRYARRSLCQKFATGFSATSNREPGTPRGSRRKRKSKRDEDRLFVGSIRRPGNRFRSKVRQWNVRKRHDFEVTVTRRRHEQQTVHERSR